jgi:hypothetical protein
MAETAIANKIIVFVSLDCKICKGIKISYDGIKKASEFTVDLSDAQ